MIGLNVGSGQRPFTSTPEVQWVNIDSVQRPEMPAPDLVCDGAHLPFHDGSVDYFVLHHVLEHFGCGEGESLIKEAHRVLKPGGALLVFVPDLRKLATWWLDGGITTQIYMTNLYGAYMGNDADRHHWGFDAASLQAFLGTMAPWQVLPFDWRTIPGADIAHDDRWILGMEAYR